MLSIMHVASDVLGTFFDLVDAISNELRSENPEVSFSNGTSTSALGTPLKFTSASAPRLRRAKANRFQNMTFDHALYVSGLVAGLSRLSMRS